MCILPGLGKWEKMDRKYHLVSFFLAVFNWKLHIYIYIQLPVKVVNFNLYSFCSTQYKYQVFLPGDFTRFMMFNATFNNISVIQNVSDFTRQLVMMNLKFKVFPLSEKRSYCISFIYYYSSSITFLNPGIYFVSRNITKIFNTKYRSCKL